MKSIWPLGLAGVLLFSIAPQTEATADAEPTSTITLYEQHCGSCHGNDRLGRMGPALLPGNLSRLNKKKAIQTITQGRSATQMPAFEKTLTPPQITALTDYLYTPPKEQPDWTLNDIKASHTVPVPMDQLPEKPVYKADMMNLFVVVELGDHHVTLLDGDRFKPIHRFPSRYALHGGPKYSPDGRFVYFASRDGWITQYDLYSLQVVAEIRAGINTRNLAISHDGRFLMAANYLPHNLVLLDARELKPLKTIEARGENGQTSRVSAVYTAPPRGSFIAAMKDIKEVWEIPYHEVPVSDYASWVHDYRQESGEGNALKTQFPIRRIVTRDYLDDFFFDPDYRHLIGTSRDSGKSRGMVVNLDVRREIAEIPMAGMPHLGSGITWDYQGREVMASPNISKGMVSVIDMADWTVIKTIETLGPGFFMRSHEQTPYAWTDVFFGPKNDAVHVIDKKTLDIVKTLRPMPGKNAAHVEFTKDGRYVLLSVWDMDGALIVYDANTLKEIKRLPMKKPSGKYNVWNKISYSRGTSH
ncbi:cytochrome D1 domain-containing protein [Kistimonas asteriae]|uniref:cytochrome D1 domain-containing protein n=1 Tax=Kistimonas asteriae TaxID=517724 RepID=UPI001FE8FD94|nr:cytochrome D1 domain-containing protein [Kistimonas asteriae]